MERVYHLIFEKEVPRVLKEMKDELHSTLEPTSD